MKTKKLFALCALCLLPVLLAGCAFLDELKLFRDGEEPAAGEEETVTEQELTVTGAAEAPAQKQEEPAEPAAGVRRVSLFFANAAGSGLEAESRDIPEQTGIARATVNELIAGPASASLRPTLPASAIVEGMTVEGGLCTVDFSSELADFLPADAESHKLAVYSVVNTLAQFDSVDKVRILIDGEPPAFELAGVDLSAALAPAML